MPLAVLAGILVPLALPAQGPTLATKWGAEVAAGIGPTTASLLRFRTPNTAWVLGAGLNLQHSTSEITGIGGAPPKASITSGALLVSVGYRAYRPFNGAVRPFTEIGAQTTYSGTYGDNVSGPHSWSIGPYLGLGASYFFSP